MINSCLSGNSFRVFFVSLKTWLSFTLETVSGAQDTGGLGFNDLRMKNSGEAGLIQEPFPPGNILRQDDNL